MSRRQFLAVGSVGVLGASVACSSTRSAQSNSYDLVVYGGTASGILAAVTAARAHLRVALVLGESPLGGMVTNGLSVSDVQNPAILGGLTKQFFVSVGKEYGHDSIQLEFEPSVATKVLTDMVKQAGISVITGYLAGVSRSGTSLSAVQLSTGAVLTATQFVDSSYEGALMSAAGVPSTYGRESQQQYNESAAGYTLTEQMFELKKAEVSAQAVLGQYPQLAAAPVITPALGSADTKVMAYNYRLCATTDASRSVPFPKPSGYDPARFQLVSRLVHPGLVVPQGKIPGGKVDLNTGGFVLNTDFVGGSLHYPATTTVAQRHNIAAAHYQYQAGLLYFLSNDPSAPQDLQENLRQYGLAADEFTGTGNWPTQLYVRESRRMVSRRVITQNDLLSHRNDPDGIGVGMYPLDSHALQLYVRGDELVIESGIPADRPAVPFYSLPRQILLPPPAIVDNLAVSVCVSASRVAYCSLRVEPHYMLMGEAAGAMAAVAHAHKTPLAQVAGADVRQLLTAGGSVLDLPS